MSRDEFRRSKRCRADRDYEMGPAAGIMVNDYDDERTLDEEEALECSEDTHNELSHLQKESNMPLKELLVMYNYGDMSCQDSNKAEDEEDEEEEEEEEEDDEEDDDDDPANDESDLKQFYTEMKREEANGANIKRSPIAKPGESAKSGEAATLASNINAQSNPANFEPKPEDRTMGGATGDASGDAQNPSSGAVVADVGPSADSVSNSTTGVPVSGSVGGGGGGGGSSRLLRSVSRPQSEEEEDDCDYSPDEEEWKKTIMVGSDYQAAIPEGLCKYDDALPYENEDKMLWDPSPVSEEAAEEFLERAQVPVVKGTTLPSGSHVRDDEQALYLLLQCGYNLEEALRRRRMNVLPPTESVSLWSEEECHNFETGLRNYGKDFHLIQKNKVRTRSVGELVQFYYLWKKTERHDIFTYKARMEKKKYALHPGITDYMDRFLEEQEGVRDRSSSPNVHCLLYGDAKRQRTSANSMSNEEPSSKSDNWDGSTTAGNSSTTLTTMTTTTTTTTTAASVAGTAAISVNSGLADPLAVDHHLHNSSSPVGGAVDYAKANNNAEASTVAPSPWPSSTIASTAIITPTTISSSSSSSSSSSTSSMQPQQLQQQQRNHFPYHLQQQQQQQQGSVGGSDEEVAAAVGTVSVATVAQSRSPENILPHLPP